VPPPPPLLLLLLLLLRAVLVCRISGRRQRMTVERSSLRPAWCHTSRLWGTLPRRAARLFYASRLSLLRLPMCVLALLFVSYLLLCTLPFGILNAFAGARVIRRADEKASDPQAPVPPTQREGQSS
jgi:hypothetical protein